MITTSAAVLDMPALGVRVELRQTAADTDGELVEFDVVGRARGFLAVEHVHTQQSEHYEVIEGALRLVVDGQEHLLGPGEEMETPVGVPHRQLPGGDGEGRIRITLRPAGRTEEFLRRLTTMRFNRFGYPRPVDAATFVRDFGSEGHASRPSLRV
ncbi:MAG TPA: cupin domain-containing protein, partial [Solirubrobacteraceae bacterium]|nr:cupin domain-containing protein [Solirubrobacteraceae bacterium]